MDEVAHANKLERQWAAAQLDAGKDINDIHMRDYKAVLKNAKIEDKKQFAIGLGKKVVDLTEEDLNNYKFKIQEKDLAKLEELAKATTVARDAEIKKKIEEAATADKELKADKAAKKVIATRLQNMEKMQAQLDRENISLELKALAQKKLEKLQQEEADYQAKLAADAAAAAAKKLADDETEALKIARSALGRIGGGLSLVGEAGGEVVASRSALRSGIGIGGRAASALAGIGVPGYQAGVVRSARGVHGREGLQGAFWFTIL